ncbi:7-carboxy-7-deazaguanine synthase QueE [Aliikangiella marina]|uniref:7-carboxy-7-deazaguanine synthase n=1 Tax=Aliikangiella marina TaxID=1712262 RepID=A0A545TD14_9GAMM|nr:7-carboxy-7-deazaguanine synthase QueE [Aliikangiella marina]TQV75108.1 7-carboxy-7-deazaguanine synthase QueE [Aliikangiella marina]
MSRLRITEIFYSLQGESSTIGKPTLFVRLTGCPLRCVWCDTEYAFTGGAYREIADLIKEIESFNPQNICITGGEPLAQKEPCEELMRILCDKGYSVSIETSGAIDVSGVDKRVTKVMDLKAPDSGELAKNRYENLAFLNKTDEVKFVIMSRKDYDWAKMQMDQYQLADKTNVIFSPCFGEINERELAEWIIADNLPVRFQLQMHKLLWDDAAGH